MVLNVNTVDPFLRQRLINVTSEMVNGTGSRGIEIVDVAERANVDVATVNEFFDSRTQLIAEVQMANYFTLVEPHHLVLSRVEAALHSENQTDFWRAVEENIIMAWSTGQINEKWGILNLLHDIWSDPFSQSHFCDLLDIQFDRWIAVIESAKQLGWVDEDLDAKALTAFFWSASVGQVITAGSSSLDLSSSAARDFLLSLVRGKNHRKSTALH